MNLSSAHSKTSAKLVSVSRIAGLADEYRRQGKRIVFTNGCFDLLHIGHVNYLEEAAAFGDILIVAVNSDAGVKRLKGPERPMVAEQHRAKLLAALQCVHHVLIFEEDTPENVLRQIRPDVLIKGGTTTEISGREFVESYGGQVCRGSEVPGVSTTKLIDSASKISSPRV
jgi:D-beta-D-heptose 7-phosphate kinase/D-beta-D-heptose 1-phosphate adenosyltransferase